MNTQTMSKEDRQVRMYGVTVEYMRAQFTEGMRLGGPKMLVMSMLSDAQEQIALGQEEVARQTINRAKWALMEFLEEPVLKTA